MGKHTAKRAKGRERKREKRKMAKWKKFILVFIIILLVLLAIAAGIGTYFVADKLGKIQKEEIDETAIGISEDNEKALSGYRNIALLGIDSRADDYGLGNRSDCIIIASINEKTKDIKLISVYRDTYMQVEEKGTAKLDKVTHAYSFGGAQNTLKALNTNLDLNISEFVTVNFDAVIAAVDAMGGVTIKVEPNEVDYLNDYVDATAKSSGGSSKHISKSGTQTLNGVQAVAYSRIRYTAGGDYKRAERMRTVIQAMLTKAKSLSLGQLNKLADTILPRISSNISSGEIISLLPSLASFDITDSLGWPYEVKGYSSDRWYGVPVTLETNVRKLHQEAFERPDYEPSSTVKAISSQIANKTGYKS